MPISHSIQVFNLIKSLTKGEKRNFRLYAKRIQDNSDLLFLRLFDYLDKQKIYDEQEVMHQLGDIKRGQFSNIKRHLYSQIIASLRMLHKEKRPNFKVREYIDYAYILYGKGLYNQALKILKKASTLAQRHHLIYMQLTIVEFEKSIETRHITRSGANKAEALIAESNFIQNSANHLVKLSNLRIRMHTKYLQYGHVRSHEEAQEIKAFFKNQMSAINLDEIGLVERIYYVQSRVWYNYILLDFLACKDNAIEWIDLLDSNLMMKERDVDLYLRGLHYVLTTSSHIRDKSTHAFYLAKIEKYRDETYGKFNPSSQILSFLYVHTGRLDHIILNGNFDEAEVVIQRSLNRIKKYSYKLDDHRIMVFYYKFAWIYLGAGNTTKAIQYVNRIIQNELFGLREDLQNYARILQLICHYEAGNFNILEYLVNTYANYFKRKEGLNDFLQQALSLFKKLKKKGELDHKGIFINYADIFKDLVKDPYEGRALMYLDITLWIESKIKGMTLQQVIQDR